MAVPKRKVSKSRKGMRRSHLTANVKRVSDCSNCGNSTLPHRICPHCGFFPGKKFNKVVVK